MSEIYEVEGTNEGASAAFGSYERTDQRMPPAVSGGELEEYQRLFTGWSDRIERMVIRMAIAFALLLLVVQAVLQSAYVRRVMVETDRLEGVPYEQGKSIP